MRFAARLALEVLRFVGFTAAVLLGMALWLTWLPLVLTFRDWMTP